MKTTIDIPEMTLRDAVRFTKAKTKKEAVVKVLEDFNRRRRMLDATRVLGTSNTFMTQDDLMKARHARRTP